MVMKIEDHVIMNNDGSMTFNGPSYTDSESNNSAIDTAGKELLFTFYGVRTEYNKLFLEHLSVLKSIFVLRYVKVYIQGTIY